jgi:hypothetical protein
MSGTGWQQRDAGSGSGHVQRIASNAAFTTKQKAYRAYLEHAVECGDCGHGETRCVKATELYRKWRAEPS